MTSPFHSHSQKQTEHFVLCDSDVFVVVAHQLSSSLAITKKPNNKTTTTTLRFVHKHRCTQPDKIINYFERNC